VDKIDFVKRKTTLFLKNNKKYLLYSLVLIVVVSSIFLSEKNSFVNQGSVVPTDLLRKAKLGEFPIVQPNLKYGFVLDTFQVLEGEVKPNETIGELLLDNGFTDGDVHSLAEKSKEVYDLVRNFRVGKSYMFLTRRGEEKPSWFVYEPNVYEYVVVDLENGMEVRKEERPVEVKEAVLHGQINSSLWVAIEETGASMEVAAKMEDALETSVDFSHVQVGDEFKLVYDEKYIEGKRVGVGNVHAAYYKQADSDKEHYVFWYDGGGEHVGFYDQEGRPMKGRFLKAPVKYTRISSRYNPRRFHPVLKRVRPHLGTDYAAPTGTPIYAVGNGVVVAKGYTKGNGNYIKIKHDKVYQTQYLHMSGFAKGIKKGSYVSQGQVIGYVGSTGLATGPHVCFRFWKNGKQINHLREYFPPSKPLPDELLPEFFKVRDVYMEKLKAVDSSVAMDETAA
jgi:murein DD-endopeptidase MepM/ murein hydrolase activator NlpD